MNNVTDFSIIVPVYGVEGYLHKCLDSIIAQSFGTWEAILIDDGSLDGSPKICDEYAKKDTRIRVFHVENGGVSRARNIGLNHAQGKYITFLDADDYLSRDYLATLAKFLTNGVDMLYYGYIYLSDKKECPRMVTDKTRQLSLKEVCRNQLYSGYVWAYAYKRSIIENQKLRFSTDLKYAEDWEFILKYYCHIRQMVAISDCLYYQLQREGSATQRKLGEVYLTYNFRMFDSILSYTSTMPLYFKRFIHIQLYGILIWFVNNVIATDVTLKTCYKTLVCTLKKRHSLFCACPLVWLPFTYPKAFGIATKITNKFLKK